MGSHEGMPGWRTRLYEAYVTSGQAGVDTDDPDEAFASRAPWIRATAKRHLPVDRKTTILDLGCGHGAFVYVLREMGFSDVTGVDVSQEQVHMAERLVWILGVLPLRLLFAAESGGTDPVLTRSLLAVAYR